VKLYTHSTSQTPDVKLYTHSTSQTPDVKLYTHSTSQTPWLFTQQKADGML
jgi:hypothetical protein